MEKTEQNYKFHPIIILYYMRWLLVLGIVPLLRGVLSAFQENSNFITTGIWIDFTIMALVVIVSILRWLFSHYHFSEDFIEVKQGIFFSKTMRLPWSRVSVLKAQSPFYLRPFGATMLKADILGGSYRNADINICISSTNCNIILELYQNLSVSNKTERVFRPKPLSVFFMAFLSTNNFIGVFYLATFISQSGKIIGEEIPDMLIGGLEHFAKTADYILSPATFVIACFLIFTWLIGVILALVRHYNYTIVCKGNNITVSGGLISKHTNVINNDEINYFTLRQNILTFFLGLYSLYVSAVGCGKERSDTTCLIPNQRKSGFYQSLDYLFPNHHFAPPTLRPSRGGFSRFLFLPFFAGAVISAAIVFGVHLVPQWSAFIKFVGTMLLILSISLLIVGFVDYITSGIGIQGDFYTFRYATRFTFHTHLIPQKSIVKIKLQQSPLQAFFGNCTVFVYTKSESRKRHKCKNVKRKEIEKLFNL